MNGAIFTPSFYGAITWVLIYVLYAMDFLQWEAAGVEAHIVFVVQITFFLIATVLSAAKFECINGVISKLGSIKHPSVKIVLLLHSLGFFGLAKFIIDFSPNLSNGFIQSLLVNPSSIRALGAEMTSIGIQISYFGWLAIGISLCYRKLNKWLLCISLAQFLMNFIFIDRTRPVWILFTALLCYLWSREHINGWKVLRILAILGAVFILLFVLIALWSGKTGDGSFSSDVNPLLGSLYIYITAGFAYFAHMVNVEISDNYFVLDRVLAPFWTVLSAFNLASPPPDQILDFYEMPYSSNVGTALEPFYRDGGFLFVLFGMIVYSFGFNAVGAWFLKRNNAYAVYAWATLCFCNLIGFFTSKIGNTPVWFFLILGYVLSINIIKPTKNAPN
jgi:oligosaccharide repeat unit polymerase